MSTTIATTAAMAAVIGAAVLAVILLTASQVDDGLQERINTAAATLHLDATGRPALSRAQAGDTDDAVWLFDATGVQLAGPEADPSETGPEADPSETGSEADPSHTATSLAGTASVAGASDGDRRFLAERVAVPGAPSVSVVLVASESVHPYERTRNLALYSLLGLGVVVVAGTAGLTSWTVGRTLHPVHRMTAQAAEWSEQDLATRFALGPGHDEFTALGNTLDALLDRVATALRGEQRLTAELAHELRTPLTAIRAEAELGQLSAPSDQRYPRIIALVDRLSTTITTLLDLARDRSAAHRRADVPEVIADLLSARPESPVEVDFRPAPGELIASTSPELVERTLAPILDNAFRFARSRVGVVVDRAGPALRIVIEDDGPGIAPGLAERLFEPGSTQPCDGTGFGLPLARRLAATSGGTVSVLSPTAPTAFEVRLPGL